MFAYFLKMKKLLAGTGILVLVLQPAMALADTPTSGSDINYYGTTVSGTPLNPADQSQYFGNLSNNLSPATSPAGSTGAPAPNNNNSPVTAAQANNSSIGCGITSTTDFAICLTNVVYVFTVGIGSGFAYVSAYFLDWAIQLSLNSLAYSQQFVSQGWTTARDIANMLFLFIILYIAFMVMFQAETNGTLQTLLHVVFIALIINFSFFGVRFVIDTGNIVAIQFYNAITAPTLAATANSNGVAGGVASLLNAASNAAGAVGGGNTKDLTASIMGMIQVTNLFNTSSFTQFYSSNPGFMVTAIALTFLYIAAAIILWVLAVTFAAAGVKFILRVVGLWFVIIVSPLALIAWALPGNGPQKLFKEWRDSLLNNAFYPVVFLFVFLMLTMFAQQMGQSNNLINGIFNGLSGNATSGNPLAAIGLAAANVGIRLGLVVAVLWFGLSYANKWKTFASNTADGFGNWVGGLYQGAVRRSGGALLAGAPGAALRSTLGYGGDQLARTSTLRNWAASNVFGRTLWRGAAAAGRQSYDIRGGLQAAGLNKDIVGAPGGQGGYTARFERGVKRREDEASKLKPSDTQLADATQEGIKAAIEKAKNDKKLDDEELKTLATLANEYVDVKKAAADGDASANDVKKAKKNYTELVKRYKREGKLDLSGGIKQAVEAAGKKNHEIYAGAIEQRSWRNVGGLLSPGVPFFIGKYDKEAAKKIRGKKTDQEHVKNVLEAMNIKPDDDDTPPPTTPSGGGGAPAPAAPGAAGGPANNVITGPWPGSGGGTTPTNRSWGFGTSHMTPVEREQLQIAREQLKEVRSQTNILKSGLANIQNAAARSSANTAALSKNIGKQVAPNLRPANENLRSAPTQAATDNIRHAQERESPPADVSGESEQKAA